MSTIDRADISSIARNLQVLTLVCCIGIFLLLLLVALWRFVQYYPENHWSVDIRWLYLFCVFGYSVSCASWLHSGLSKIVVLNLVICSLLLLLIACLGHFNLLMGYDVWLKRGMPEPFQ
jgi:hypothetical protein